MTEPKETVIDIEQAYKDKVFRIYHPAEYRKEQKDKERKKRGVCIVCGNKKIRVDQRRKNRWICVGCRQSKKEGESEIKNKIR